MWVFAILAAGSRTSQRVCFVVTRLASATEFAFESTCTAAAKARLIASAEARSTSAGTSPRIVASALLLADALSLSHLAASAAKRTK